MVGYQELRSQGRQIQTVERQIGLLSQKIQYKESKGRPVDQVTRDTLAGLQQQYARFQQDPNFRQAYAAAPQHKVEPGYQGRPLPPPNVNGAVVVGGSPTGVNSKYDTIPNSDRPASARPGPAVSGGYSQTSYNALSPQERTKVDAFYRQNGNLRPGTYTENFRVGPYQDARQALQSDSIFYRPPSGVASGERPFPAPQGVMVVPVDRDILTEKLISVQSSQEENGNRAIGMDLGGDYNSILFGTDQVVDESSPRFKALESFYPGFEKRQERLSKILKPYEKFSSFITFGNQKPIGERNFVGRVAQKTAFGLSTFLTGVGFGAIVGNAADKAFLETGALITPETSQRAREESKNAFFSGTVEELKNPETYASLAATLGLSAAAGKAIPTRTEVPVEIRPRSGSAAITRVTENSLTSTQRLMGVARVDGKVVPVESNVLLVGERVPQTDFFTTRVEIVSAIPTEKGIQFSTQNFVGPLNTRNALLSLANREGTQFFGTQTGRGVPVFGDSVSVIENNPTRFINLGTNKGSVIPVVKSTGEANILSETNAYNKIPYKNIDGINAFGEPQNIKLMESNTGFLVKGTGGANTDLFRGTFQNLERAGLYQDPYFVQGPGISMLKSRRGAINLPTGSIIEETGPIANFPEGTKPTTVKPIDLSGIELTGTVTKTVRAQAPIIPLFNTPSDNESITITPTITPIAIDTTTIKPKEKITILSPSTILSPDTAINVDTATKQNTSFSPDTTQATESIQATTPIVTPTIAQDIGSSQSFKQSLSLQQQYLTKSQTGQDTLLKNNVSFINEPRVGKEQPFVTSSERRVKGKVYPVKKKLVQGYDVLLKRKGKFDIIGRNLSRGEALLRGEKAALGSLAATFKLQKSGGFAEDTGRGVNSVSRYFRDYAIRGGKRIPLVDTFIQRRGQRLVTSQERSQIQSARKQSGFFRKVKGGVGWL